MPSRRKVARPHSPSFDKDGIVHLPHDPLATSSANPAFSLALQHQTHIKCPEERVDPDSALGAPPRDKLVQLGLSFCPGAFRPDLLPDQRAESTVDRGGRDEDVKGQKTEPCVVGMRLRAKRILNAGVCCSMRWRKRGQGGIDIRLRRVGRV